MCLSPSAAVPTSAAWWFVSNKDYDSRVAGAARLQGTTEHSRFLQIRLPET